MAPTKPKHKIKRVGAVIYRFVIFVGSLFIWFIYSFYTLDRSGDVPEVTNLSLLLLLVLIIFNFREWFIRLFKWSIRSPLFLYGFFGFLLSVGFYKITPTPEMLISVIQLLTMPAMVLALLREKRYLASTLLSVFLALGFYTGLVTFVDYISLALFVIGAAYSIVKLFIQRKISVSS